MKVRIRIDAVAALKSGSDKHGLFVVDVPAVDLTQQQRDTLATMEFGSDEKVDFYLDRGLEYASDILRQSVIDADVATVCRCLDAIHQEKLDTQAKTDAAVKAKADRNAEYLRKWCAQALADRIEEYGSTWIVNTSDNDTVKDTHAYAEAAAECKRRNDEATAIRKAAADAEARVLALGMATLASWVDTHGDKLVKARKAGDYEWVGLAEQQYADWIVKDVPMAAADDIDGDDFSDFDTSERSTPTLDEIGSLERVRDSIKSGDDLECELVWCTYVMATEEDNIQRAEIEVAIIAPTGRTLYRYFLPAEATAAMQPKY